MDNREISTSKDKIMSIQDRLDSIPGVMYGNCFPLKHSFGEGLYIREIFMPAGSLIVSKTHKFEHPYFILQGKVSVMTEGGSITINAPFYDITKAGTKRVLYIHEDCVWCTVHANPGNIRDIETLEKEFTVDNFEDFDRLPKTEDVQNFITEACNAVTLSQG